MRSFFAPASGLDIALQKSISTPAVIGAPVQVVNNYQVVASSSVDYVTTADIPPNSYIQVTALGLSSVGLTAVTDGVNGSYTGRIAVSASFQRKTFGIFCVAGLPSGSTISTTWSSAGSSAKFVSIEYITGIRASSPWDKGGGVGTEANPSATPSITITAPAHANSIILTMLTVSGGASDGFTQDPDGWTARTSVSGGTHILRLAYKIVSSLAAESYEPVLGTSRFWTENYEIIKGE